MGNLRKILIVTIILILSLSIKSYAEVLNKVEAKGNQRISLETIMIFPL